MRRAALASALFCAFALGIASCGSKGATCGRVTLAENTPGGCRTGRALLLCAVADFPCGCVTNEQSCPECPGFHGAGCFNACAGDEYAVECGAVPTADAGPVVVYDDPPQGCQLIAQGSAAIAAYCCPCQ